MRNRPALFHDVAHFSPADRQASAWKTVVMQDPHAEEFLSTYVRVIETDESELVAIGGVQPLWPGVGEVWISLGPLAYEHAVVTARHIKKILRIAERDFSFHRVQAACEITQEVTHRFLEHLHYVYEGTHMGLYERGVIYKMYAKALS